MAKIHTLADVQSKDIGENTSIWQFTVVLKEAVIGDNCNICSHIFIENNVVIGNNVTIKAGVQIWDGTQIDDDVFIGPNATFTNDMVPISKPSSWTCLPIHVQRGASIGANATILPGVVIGEFALIGAGSVITKDVPPFTLWYGNPAEHRGYRTQDGILLDKTLMSKDGIQHIFKNKILIPK